MEKVIRKGIAFEPGLLKKFDKVIKKKGYANRSEAIRDLIREHLIKEEWKSDNTKKIATLTMVYNHHAGDVQKKLTDIQHHSPQMIKSSLHIHLDEHNCLEVLILEGKANTIKQFSNRIIATKGVLHGKLVLT